MGAQCDSGENAVAESFAPETLSEPGPSAVDPFLVRKRNLTVDVFVRTTYQ